MKPLVIYHADCTDGFGAAFAAWLKLGDEAEYLPMSYGEKLTEDNYRLMFRDAEVYVLDFSFPRETMNILFEEAKRVVWLDHHKTAFEMWCDDGEQDSYFAILGGIIVLDNSKSGALLAWEHFHLGKEVPMLIQHIDDRDRWQFKLDGTKEIHAALASYKPWNFEQWRQWNTFWGVVGGGRGEILMTEGEAILRAQEQHVKRITKQKRACVIPVPFSISEEAWGGLAVNATMHISEVGHELANQCCSFGLVWHLGSDGRAKCSLRSNGDYDVSAIAKCFGGGGHRNAAGFEIDVETLMGWMK
jgi:oligoribonuclease NrnB/cAMP/cGMP phosphodiesterase (DHH superfamily)